MRPVPVRGLSVLLAVEGGALVLLGLGYAVVSALGSPESLAGAELAAAFAVAAGGVLGLLGRAVVRRRPWARTPALLLNLLAVPVAVGLLQAHVWAVGVPVLLVPLAALALLASPQVRAALRET